MIFLMLTEYDIKTLKDYFAKHRDVAFAFLFGSQASGKASSLSDIDMAVYLYPELREKLKRKGKSRNTLFCYIWLYSQYIVS